jgi:hypothetical protein
VARSLANSAYHWMRSAAWRQAQIPMFPPRRDPVHGQWESEPCGNFYKIILFLLNKPQNTQEHCIFVSRTLRKRSQYCTQEVGELFVETELNWNLQHQQFDTHRKKSQLPTLKKTIKQKL